MSKILLPETITDELIGKIVQFYYHSHTGFPLTVIFRIVPLFTSIEAQNIIIGDFIAGEAQVSILLKKRISSYQILTLKDLPLLIGYEFKTPLLEELLKG